MAMCFSLVALGGVPVRINDPECVAKTFPDYFERFAQITLPAQPSARGKGAEGQGAETLDTSPKASEAPVIAIDGPSASGKGTVARRVAEVLGFQYLDSGALYRLVALRPCAPGSAWPIRRPWREWRRSSTAAFRAKPCCWRASP